MGEGTRKEPPKKFDLAEFVEAAFREGYDSYETPCCAFSSQDSAWQNSEARASLLAHLAKEPTP